MTITPAYNIDSNQGNWVHTTRVNHNTTASCFTESDEKTGRVIISRIKKTAETLTTIKDFVFDTGLTFLKSTTLVRLNDRSFGIIYRVDESPFSFGIFYTIIYWNGSDWVQTTPVNFDSSQSDNELSAVGLQVDNTQTKVAVFSIQAGDFNFIGQTFDVVFTTDAVGNLTGANTTFLNESFISNTGGQKYHIDSVPASLTWGETHLWTLINTDPTIAYYLEFENDGSLSRLAERIITDPPDNRDTFNIARVNDNQIVVSSILSPFVGNTIDTVQKLEYDGSIIEYSGVSWLNQPYTRVETGRLDLDHNTTIFTGPGDSIAELYNTESDTPYREQTINFYDSDIIDIAVDGDLDDEPDIKGVAVFIYVNDDGVNLRALFIPGISGPLKVLSGNSVIKKSTTNNSHYTQQKSFDSNYTNQTSENSKINTETDTMSKITQSTTNQSPVD